MSDIIQTLECEGRLSITWSNNCQQNFNMTTDAVPWAVFGLALTARNIAIQTNVTLCILISCAIFLLSTIYIKGSEVTDDDELAQVTPIELRNITNLAEQLSKFTGESLLGYLLLHGLSTPMEVESIFSGSALVILSFFVRNSMIVIGLLLGSVAALRVSRYFLQILFLSNILLIS